MNDAQPDHPPTSILIVDDTPDNLYLLSAMLTEQGYDVRCVINGSAAIMGAIADPPDLILLDIRMPQMSGYEVCKQLKSSERTRDIPVIFLSALNEVFDKIQAFEVGGLDYITKPFEIREVLARIKNQLNLQEAKLQIQKLNTELEQRVRERTKELELANLRLLHMASHDALTGLPNRVFFMERLMAVLAYTRTYSSSQFAVLFLDCDDFKVVNDSLGHLAGDQLLKAVARRLSNCINHNYTLARFEGDEFTVLLEKIESVDEATQLAETIQQALSKSFSLHEHEVFINTSIGIVLGNSEYEQPEHLLRDADTAMYQAKTLGKARYQVFNREMHTRALTRLQLENDLRRAIERQEFIVYYQPIICLLTGKISSFEALVRWKHPQGGLVSPDHFIPVAEATGLIVPLGFWVLEHSCRQLKLWQEQSAKRGEVFDITMSVNLSVKQFSQGNLIEEIDQVLESLKLDSKNLKLEITESAIMDNPELASELFEQLKERKIQLSLDDFGTGYSSLSYLHRFPLDIIKIDRSFISNLDSMGKNLEVVQAILNLAHHLGMSVVAEGIETPEQLSLLRLLGCELAQGYLFAQPLDAEATETLLFSDPQW
ncbi:Two-component response regulator [Planktothrix sp. PCC 11201]|uniref:two-component system response regulator n=1 Tax=Planktothrix sp. PCC 11201 TaxID=1729650 RepID=UPI0009237D39|nr:GGDEF domain-containing response regulator [Planktothrix sp. PCC 11201]SKB15687.1 Two-component response regulator [Planktothrix sp. PCC 11201]